MIIVSDTTPLHYLILIGKDDILPALFDEIIIPEAVLAELSHARTPDIVLDWIRQLPDWIDVRHAPTILTVDIAALGKGETEAIALAISEKAEALLMDDKRAIRQARLRGLTVITIFGILELASAKGLLHLIGAIDELRRTNFRLPPEEIIAEIIERDARREM